MVLQYWQDMDFKFRFRFSFFFLFLFLVEFYVNGGIVYSLIRVLETKGVQLTK